MAKVISKSERLFKRINREFASRKFIGDIPISDEEFEILLMVFKTQFQYLQSNKYIELSDPVLATTLVQIGIRKYDGNYWKHVKEVLGCSKFGAQQQTQLGKSFLRTINEHDKVRLGGSERIDTALMHGFVADYYADLFFDFLFAFYQIDLDRDLSRLNHDTMNQLIEVMCRSDNTGRTYNLREQTADAVRSSKRSAKTRIRRYLKLIDRAFWNEDLPESSTSRIVKRLLEWTKKSEKFVNVQRKYTGGVAGRTKSFSSPYISCNYEESGFYLMLPKQTIEFEKGVSETLQWEIEAAITKGTVSVDIIEEGVTGFLTEEVAVRLPKEDLFCDIVLLLKSGDQILRKFKIKKETIRFFDENGLPVANDSIKPGTVYSYSGLGFVPTGRGVLYSEKSDGLIFTAYDVEIGDLILLPDGKPISVGRDIKEGLQFRGDIPGLSADNNGETVPVYSNVPQIIFRAVENRLPGTAILLDGKIYGLADLDQKKDCLMKFDPNDRSGEKGYLLDCSVLDVLNDGMHEICIDIPNDHTNRRWKFLLIQDFTYKFEDAPYVFQSHGSLVFPHKYALETVDGGKIEKEPDGYVYNFSIVPGVPEIRLRYQENIIRFAVPALSYKFEGEEWQTAPHLDIWHSDFQPKLFLDYDRDKVRFFMDDTDDEGEEHSQVFVKNKKTGLFECDLNRFKSWFGRDQIRKNIYLDLMDKKPIRFLKVVTQSYLISGLLTASFHPDQINGIFDIAGKAEYYVDLFLKDHVVMEKIHLTDGAFSAQIKLNSGLYKAVVYEAEEDDSGFGEDVFYKIGEKELDLINPMDLNGKCVEVKAIIPAENPKTYYPIKYKYHIVGLSNSDTESQYDYAGKMVVFGSLGDKVFATFPVNVNFYDPDDLRNTYITFPEDGEQMDFLYDESLKKIVKQEDGCLRKREAYRRYRFSGPEELIYHVDFFNPSQEELSFAMDDGEYNNLISRPKSNLVFKEKSKERTKGIPIGKMELSIKSFNALRRAGLNDSEQIFCIYQKGQLLKVRNLGRSSFEEVENKLKKLGYPVKG